MQIKFIKTSPQQKKDVSKPRHILTIKSCLSGGDAINRVRPRIDHKRAGWCANPAKAGAGGLLRGHQPLPFAVAHHGDNGVDGIEHGIEV